MVPTVLIGPAGFEAEKPWLPKVPRAQLSPLWSANSPTVPAVDGSAFSCICVSTEPEWNVPLVIQSDMVVDQVVESPGVETRRWMPCASFGHCDPVGGTPVLQALRPTVRKT